MASIAPLTHSRADTRIRNYPIALWHLLSFDAPTVAALWTWFLAASNRIHLPLTSTIAMALAVWTLYAADRLLDARLLNARLLDVRLSDARLSDARFQDTGTRPADLEARHLFHHHHRRAFRLGLVFSSLALALLLPHLAGSAISLYLILGALLIGYFVLIHVPRSDPQETSRLSSRRLPARRLPARRLPKELAVGLFFSAATFIPTVAREPGLRIRLLPNALLFALLCSLNCLFIYHWEHPRSTGSTTHWATRVALGWLTPLTRTTAAVSFVLAVATLDHSLHVAPWPISSAIGLAALLLLVLDRYRATLSATVLRAAADLCLVTPILFLPFLLACPLSFPGI